MNTLQQNTQHSPFTLSIDDQQIASLIVNVTDKKRNTLSAEFVDQMLQLLNNLPKETKGLIFYSSKKNNFIQGFDLNSLMGKSDNELEAFLDKIHRLMENHSPITISNSGSNSRLLFRAWFRVSFGVPISYCFR